VAEPQVLEADICIIGAGAAGITLAKSFAGHQARIILLESGGEHPDETKNALFSALNVGRPYSQLPHSQLKHFGGAMNYWGGHCAPMRRINFEVCPTIPHSGWPFSYDELDTYYQRAHELIGLGPFHYEAEYASSLLELRLFPFDPEKVETTISRYSSKRFGQAYRNELHVAKNVKIVLNANVILVDRDPINPVINRVVVATLNGRKFSVSARTFVLAAGAIENARLLLHSRNVEANGLGNGYDLVGRFFMEHIYYPSGTIVPFNEFASFDIYGSEIPFSSYEGEGLQYRIRAHVALPEGVVRSEQISDFRAEIEIINPIDGSDAVFSASRLWDDFKQMSWPDDLRYHLGNIGDDPLSFVSLLARSKSAGYAYKLRNNFEQTPNPNSRIGLAEERDVFDVPLAAVDWRLTDLDKYCIRRAHELIATEVGRSGFGRFRIELEDAEEIPLRGAGGCYHHMGTTRMHDNPRLGVVDANAKVHGLSNLFIAGSSIFPTAGYVNPTLTIVALTLRLADHLKAWLGVSSHDPY
jgi:choline dehydrogenase-like flavoprotein